MFTPSQLIESPAGRPVIYYRAPPYDPVAVVTFTHCLHASYCIYLYIYVFSIASFPCSPPLQIVIE